MEGNKGDAEKGQVGRVEDKEWQVQKIHLKNCRAPPTATAKGKEMEWKRNLRYRVEAALKKVDPGAQVSVTGTAYHFSRRNERTVTMETKNWTSRNEIAHVVLGATKQVEQNWAITATVVADWVEVIMEEVDGRERGMWAQRRAEEIAKANGWKLAPRAPQWVGQKRNFDTYAGTPTGLVMTIVRKDEEPPAEDCVDSPYIVYGKKVVRKLKVYMLHRNGAHNFYLNNEGYKVSSRAL